ncbi:MAG: radical SAM protein [Candidatus Marinimicrobia bacterium]|nr:radical SAM protein [Candidatus Neomarinimicrobiota bacterium]
MLKVNEIFHSIQGESSHAGRPCVFVRLTGCNLRCTWCDTEYAFYEGEDLTVDQVLERVAAYGCRLVEVTGGEPLMQPGAIELMGRLLKDGYEVLLETGGSLPIGRVPRDVIKIVDFKAPSSGMVKKNLWSILDDLAPQDEIKFVIGDRADYDWAKAALEQHDHLGRHTVLFSPVFGRLEPQTLSEWILGDRLPVRFQLQLHKIIWEPDLRGV